MMWTMFVSVLLAKVVGNAIWHFLQLWLTNQNWYMTIVTKLSTKLTKKVMEDWEN